MFSTDFLVKFSEATDRLDHAEIEKMAVVLAAIRARGGRLFILGSGGGAGHASHAVNDFRKICGFEAYCPSDNVSELTARINDESWDACYANWLIGSRLRAEDGLLVFSVGGGSFEPPVSMNLVRAMQRAKEVGAAVTGIVGRNGGATKQLSDACVVVPTIDPTLITPIVESMQAVVWHLLVSHPKLQMNKGKWEEIVAGFTAEEAARVITTRTPLRVTLGGGGTDLASYYGKSGGFIFAMALDKYIHVAAHRPLFDRRLLINGEAIEPDDSASHPIVRAALQRHGVSERFEISSLADIGGGTGMGSSSTFLVGLLNALHTLEHRDATAAQLAEEACDLEINALSRGIGKQDQYMAAFGGLTRLDIAPDGTVSVSAVEIDPLIEREFIAHTHIYYTGLRRDAAVVLADQNTAMTDAASDKHKQVQDSLDQIKDLGHRIMGAWQTGDLSGWGRMLDEHWQQKKRLGSRISWPTIDALYDAVRSRHHVAGGKIIGAGGGGFMMLFCENDGVELERFMLAEGLPRLHYRIDRAGSSVVYHAGEDER